MSDVSDSRVVELIGVYHADGGPIGEAKYIIGKLFGSAHCALCDITHSPVRRKPEWDRMVARIGLPFTLLHLNELPDDVAAETRVQGSPLVLARLDDNTLVPLLRGQQLEDLHHSVAEFEAALLPALTTLIPADPKS